jgi:murein DD-endopeptidase MepM/ murein hydrolase activator NlpD
MQRNLRADVVWLPITLAGVTAIVASLVTGGALIVAATHPAAEVAGEAHGVPIAPPPLGVLSWPLPGATVTQGFGPSAYSIEPQVGEYRHFHTGLDLQGPPGSLILASAAGKVTLVALSTGSGPQGGYGTYIVIDHGRGLTTLYAHLATPLVHKGEAVTRGEPLGVQGSTGNSTGPHLHFEVQVDGTPIDPARCFPAVAIV